MAVGVEGQTLVDWGCIVLALAVVGLIVAVVIVADRAPVLPVAESDGSEDDPPKKRAKWHERDYPPPWIVRVGTIPTVIVGILLFRIAAGCGGTGQGACPGYALANPWILRGERGAAALLGMMFLLLVVCRLGIQGRLPDRISKDGPEWDSTAVSASQQGIDTLDGIVKDNARAVKRLSASTRKSFELVSADIDKLKNAAGQVG